MKAGSSTLLAAVLFSGLAAASPPDRPLFKVDVPYPTKDKPQSKLWFAQGTWWAWLPVRGGSSVWRRTGAGWQRQTHLDQGLQGLPGQADVWADEDTARAVLAETDRLAVVGLRWDRAALRYRLAATPVKFSMPERPAKDGGIETSTITRDGRGRWWIAYNWRRDMWVRSWSGKEGQAWSEAMAVNQSKASDDDLCSIVALPNCVGVIWSDQEKDAMYFRWHADSAQPDQWSEAGVAEQGGQTADDHIHAAVAADGTLYVASKNSLDTIGQPQLVLRVRDPHGKWANYPYALRTEKLQPSRPIVLLGDNAARLILLHSLYRMDRPTPPQSTIAWQTTGLARLDLAAAARMLIDAATRVNDVTGAKARLPAGQTWIVLASDQEGNVYEAQLN